MKYYKIKKYNKIDSSSSNNKKISIEKMFASCMLTFLAIMILLCVIMEYLCNIAFPMNSFKIFSLKHNYKTHNFDTLHDHHKFGSFNSYDDDVNLNDINNCNYIHLNCYNSSLYIVLHGAGVYIRKEQHFKADIINVLPFGSIVKVINRNNQQKKEEENIEKRDFIRITFPVNGWIVKKSVMKIVDFDNMNMTPNIINNKQYQNDNIEIKKEEKLMLKNVDITKVNLINQPISVKSAHECAHICEYEAVNKNQEALCGGWTYTITGECWLKDMRAMNISNHRKTLISNRVVSGLNSNSKSIAVYKPLDHRDRMELITHLQQNKPSTTKSFIKPLLCCNQMTETEITWKSVYEGSYHPTSAMSSATYVLKQQFSTSFKDDTNGYNWVDQFPISTGRTGALVGGTLHNELIPISIAGFYVPVLVNSKSKEKRNNMHSKSLKFENGKNNNINKTPYDYFKSMRKSLWGGNITDSMKAAENLAKNNVGPLNAFEYGGDLVLVFCKHANQCKFKSNNNKVNNDKKYSSIKNVRSAIFDNLRNSLQFDDNNNEKDWYSYKEDLKGDVLHSQRILDTRHGVVSSTFIDNGGNQDGTTNDNDVWSPRLHGREWFGSGLGQTSNVEHVLVGRLSCQHLYHHHHHNNNNNCLHIALQIGRQSSLSLYNYNLNLKPNLKTKTKNNNNLYVLEKLSDTETLLGYNLEISPNSGNIDDDNVHLYPKLHICVLTVCNHGETSYSFTSSGDNSKQQQNAISCSNSKSMEIYAAVEMSTGGEERGDETQRIRNIKELQDHCKTRVVDAKNQGYESLRKQHIKAHSDVMEASNIYHSNKEKEEDEEDKIACMAYPFKDKLAYLTKHKCAKSNNDENNDTNRLQNSIDPILVANQMQFSKYLHISSARSNVPNLQGVWADGPTAPWNGDYHLNINMQMHYFGSEQFGLSSLTAMPLFAFMQSLARKNSDTARNMYQCRGWVAHGFTDNTLAADLKAESQWSLCVSCGAWMALQLWEHVTFSSWYNKEMTDKLLLAIDVFRGVVEFFIDYMYIDIASNVAHTGPTTSPENAYMILSLLPDITFSNIHHHNRSKIHSQIKKHNNISDKKKTKKLKRQASHLSFSPAIDSAILRQVSNVFSILSNWMTTLKNDPAFKHLDFKYSIASQISDQRLAKQFEDLIKKMPGGATPIISEFDNLILEYPQPFPSAIIGTNTNTNNNSNSNNSVNKLEVLPSRVGEMIVTEDMDRGHRHWSSMIWLYPGTFLPGDSNNKLSKAAEATIEMKYKEGSGHTGWSLGWLSTLQARIRQGIMSWNSLNLLLKKYTAGNGMTMHPPLIGINNRKTNQAQCSTCFHDIHSSIPSSLFEPKIKDRGLETSRDDKFQLDGHGAYLGTIAELYVMSHIPGRLFLLPNIQPTKGLGWIRGLHSRGDIQLSMMWNTMNNDNYDNHHNNGYKSELIAAELLFNHPHPWLYSYKWQENHHYPGFFTIPSSSSSSTSTTTTPTTLNTKEEDLVYNKAAISIYFPDKGTGDDSYFVFADNNCAVSTNDDRIYKQMQMDLPASPTMTQDMSAIMLYINRFPCQVLICRDNQEANCREKLSKFEVESPF